MRWRKVTLIGVGLLGGSLGLALKRRALAERVTGYVRRESSMAECIGTGAVDEATLDLAEAVSGADLVVFCTPLLQMSALARKAAPHMARGTLVTDVGSVKAELVSELTPVFSEYGAVFVGSHPMAGSEKMGVSAARADLFDNAVCVVTPGPSTKPEAISRTEALWQSAGARTLRMDPGQHDALVARSSHLPHVIAAHLAGYVLDPASPPEQGKLCANGFRDSTRIASGSPEMWRDIVAMNQKEIAGALREFSQRIEAFQEMLERNDPAEIEGFFRDIKALRDHWAAGSASSSPE